MFRQVDPKQDFVALEQEIIKFWEKEKISQKYLSKNKLAKKRWSFLDGPITANNPMGVHHAWGRTLKDLWQRFYTMNGYRQRYQNGFDCQGLWVEVEVEKELGFRTKKDIEKYGIGKFVNRCKERVLKYSKIQTDQSIRLGQWMDWDHSYYTMSDNNNYTIWHFLKICAENGWIYKGNDSVPWCPRCGTAISQHEILTEEYKDVIHDAVYFKLPITSKGWEKHSLLVWTTTPWTIPANVAVAVDPKKDYAITEIEKQKVVLLASRAESVLGKSYKKIKIISGKRLLGLEYEMPFSEIVGIKAQITDYKYHVVSSDDLILPVTDEEGTGLVHIAPGAGSEDFQLGKKYNLPVVRIIAENADYLEFMDFLANKNAKKHPEIIFDYLKSKGKGKFLLKIEPYRHRYPTCWRCKTELVWRNVSEWYIAMDRSSRNNPKTFRQRMVEVTKTINWVPKWGLDRELDWLNNMHDWLISKKRYWGLALPIYECDCGNFEVIGSRSELKNRAISGWDKFDGNSPHRPWIDEVKIKCSTCGKSVERIKDVGNPWLDAGIVPFSTITDPNEKNVSYLDDKKYWCDWFPAEFITESFPGQFKNWFYSLIAMSAALENTAPFKNILGYASVRDEKGEEMHKSKGNAIWFDDAVERIGVDVMRWMYARHNPVMNLNFGYGPAQEVMRSFILMLWNTYSFFVTYSNIDHWQVITKQSSPTKQNLLDQWILARLDELIEKVTVNLKKYNSYQAVAEIELFVTDLSTWYLRRSRKRRDNSFYATMHNVLMNLSALLAPFIPHFAESIYQNLKTTKDPESVHLCDWPVISHELSASSRQLLIEMQEVRLVVEKTHALRAENGIKVRQPLQKLTVKSSKLSNKELLQIIADEVNVKIVEVNSKQKEEVILDTKITPELHQEGIFREIVRQIQSLRKKAGLSPQDKVNIFLVSSSKITQETIKRFKDDIIKQTIAQDIVFTKPDKPLIEQTDKDPYIGLNK